MDRYARQAKLAEVGFAGQARIARAFVDICLDGAAADVAARYLAGAGVAGVRVRDASLARFGSAISPTLRVEVDPRLSVCAEQRPFDLRDPACLDLARGASSALRALRAELEVASPGLAESGS